MDGSLRENAKTPASYEYDKVGEQDGVDAVERAAGVAGDHPQVRRRHQENLRRSRGGDPSGHRERRPARNAMQEGMSHPEINLIVRLIDRGWCVALANPDGSWRPKFRICDLVPS